MHMHLYTLLTGGGGDPGGSSGAGDDFDGSQTISSGFTAFSNAGLPRSVIITLLVIIAIAYLFRSRDLGLVDYIVTILLAVLLSTASIVWETANIIPSALTEAANERGAYGPGIYWGIVIILFILSSVFFLKENWGRPGWYHSRGWLIMVFLMAVLLASSDTVRGWVSGLPPGFVTTVLVIIAILYLFRNRALSTFDYFVAMLLAVLLSTVDVIRRIANIVPRALTDFANERGAYGPGIYWGFVLILFIVASIIYLRGYGRPTWHHSRGWLIFAFLMAVLLVSSDLGRSIVDAVFNTLEDVSG